MTGAGHFDNLETRAPEARESELFAALAAQIAHRWRPVPDPGWYRALERTYRTRHEVYHHELRPGASASGAWGGRLYPVHVNSLGFRDREPRDVPLHSERPRILFLGDSTTEGTGVRYPETFVGLIAERMQASGIEV